MPKKGYVYIIDWTEKHGGYKIGHTTNIEYRYYQLCAIYGDADLKNSYWIECESETESRNIESALHIISKEFNMNLPQITKGDGHREFFYKDVLRDVEYVCGRRNFELHKGILIGLKPEGLKEQEIADSELKANLKKFINIFDEFLLRNDIWELQTIKQSEPYKRSAYVLVTKRPSSTSSYITEEKWNLLNDFSRSIYGTRYFTSGPLYDNHRGVEFNDNELTGVKIKKDYVFSKDFLTQGFEDYLNQFEDKVEQLYDQKRDEIENWIHPKFEWSGKLTEDSNYEYIFRLYHIGAFERIDKSIKFKQIKKVVWNGEYWVIFHREFDDTLKIYPDLPLEEENLDSFRAGFYFQNESERYEFTSLLGAYFTEKKWNGGSYYLPSYELKNK